MGNGHHVGTSPIDLTKDAIRTYLLSLEDLKKLKPMRTVEVAL